MKRGARATHDSFGDSDAIEIVESRLGSNNPKAIILGGECALNEARLAYMRQCSVFGGTLQAGGLVGDHA